MVSAAPVLWYLSHDIYYSYNPIISSDSKRHPCCERPQLRHEFFKKFGGGAPFVDWLLKFAKRGDRVLLDPRLELLIGRDMLYREGIYDVADLNMAGLAPVSGSFKGISMDKFSPDPQLWYGQIQARTETLENNLLLDVAGIDFVIVLEWTQTHYGPFDGLEILDRFDMSEYGRVLLLRNTDRWPKAFLVTEDGIKFSPDIWPSCPHDRLMCANLDGFEKYLLPEKVDLVYNPEGDASMSFPESTSTRYLVLSWMFRNNWIASFDNGDILNTLPILKSFIGVKIPPGATQINIHYRPTERIVLVLVKVIVILASILVLVFWKPRNISA